MCRWAIILFVLSFVSTWAQAQSMQSSEAKTPEAEAAPAPNVVSVEALGRAAMYSVNYDRP